MPIPTSDAAWTRATYALALVAVLVGIVARLDSLDRRNFWVDESFAMLRVSGHSERELAAAYDGRVRASRDLLALQTVTPARGLGATVASLREEPQRGPLFYVLARLWCGWAGNDVAAIRRFSALLGIAGIGLAFAVGLRLAGGALGGAIVAALVALAPIAIRFSQQVREFVLVEDLALLATWLVARAIDRPSWSRWSCYAACAVAGVLTNPTFAAVVAAQGIAVGAVAFHRRERAPALGFLGAAVAAALACAPWFLGASRSPARATQELAWAATPASPSATLLKWAFNLGASFFDAEYAHRAWGVVLLPLLALVAAAVVRALARLRAHPDDLAAPLAFALLAATSAPLVALDALEHAHFATIARYQIPTWLGVQLLVAVALAARMRSSRPGSRALATTSLAFVVACGCASFVADRAYDRWWDDNDRLSERAVARTIAAGPQPALVAAAGDTPAAFVTFVLARYLPPDTALLLYDGTPHVPGGYAATYLFAPSAAVRSAVARAGPTLRNVSPAVAFAVPEVDAPTGNDAVRAENALWRVAFGGR